MPRPRWPRLAQTARLVAPLSGRPGAVEPRVARAPHAGYLAVFDAVPARDEGMRDDEDALRVRVLRLEGHTFTEILVHTPKGVGFRLGETPLGEVAASDAGAAAFTAGGQVHVVRPGDEPLVLEAPGAFPFFDPLAPDRLRLLCTRDAGEVIETYDLATGDCVDVLAVGTGGGFAPQVDPETGDVLLFDGWYARADGAHLPCAEDDPGLLVRLGHDVLFVPEDAEAAVRRHGRAGAPVPVPEAFEAWRQEDPGRAQVPPLTSPDGEWLVVPWSSGHTRFHAGTLVPEALPPVPPRHTHLGSGLVALLDGERAGATRLGLFVVDLRQGRLLGEGPVALLDLAVAGGRVVSLHEDGVRLDGAGLIRVDEPVLDGLRVDPRGRHAAVRTRGLRGPVVVLDLAEGAEVAGLDDARAVTWADPRRLVVLGDGGLRALDVEDGSVTSLGEAPPAACLGSDGNGRFFVATGDALVHHAGDGAVRASWQLPRKIQGYAVPDTLAVAGDAVYALARGRVFRWDAAGACTRLTALETAVRAPRLNPALHAGVLRAVAVSPDGLRLAASARTPSGALGVFVFDRGGEVVGATGPLGGRFTAHDERGFCAFHGASLVVGTEDAAVSVYAVPG